LENDDEARLSKPKRAWRGKLEIPYRAQGQQRLAMNFHEMEVNRSYHGWLSIVSKNKHTDQSHDLNVVSTAYGFET
jgi:hypothetical protein